MSRAFVREDDAGAGDALPDRPVSPHRNLVTAEGLRQIEAELDGARRRLAEATAADDRDAAAAARRDGRYWSARRASAELAGHPGGSEAARFGSLVTVERADGRRRSFRIVGEDEADPSRELLSYLAPLARAVLGRRPGDEVEFAGETVLVVSLGQDQGDGGGGPGRVG